ncbi:MAG: hypothetical protein N2379_00485 [Verrucomicrobiae bacterium]|nr:hypothetical protein [Verrucomicrobiae bacterium]
MVAVVVMFLLSILTGAGGDGTKPTALHDELARAITNQSYRAPTEAEFAAAKELFKKTFKASGATPELKAEWGRLGFELREVSHGKEMFLLLAAPHGSDAGAGWYLFRVGKTAPVAIQTPHARNDVHTGLIGLELFLVGPFRAYAASTITRHKADMAHLDLTYFQAFTVAFAETCNTGMVVQLHGFDAARYKDISGQIVASAGTDKPLPWLGALTRRMAKATSLRVLAYPDDTRRLGGTTNAQATALRQHVHCRFLHLELSRELRDRLVKDKRLQREIVNVLADFDPS